MDSGEGGGDGGGGEERDTALSPWALPPPLLTLVVIPEEGSSSHTSAGAPAKEPLSPPPQEEWGEGEGEGAEGSHAGEETRGGGAAMKDGGGLVQGSGGCEQQGAEEPDRVGHLSGPHTGERGSVAHSSRGGDEEEKEEENGEEVAVSNQSQTKSKCSLLPQQSQHSSSSSTAMASSRASPLPPPASPKHFSRPSSPPSSDTEVRDGKGEQGWTSGLPQSFKSQESALGLPPAGPDDDDDDDDDDDAEGDGAKAPEPNYDQQEREARDGEQDVVLRNLSQDLSPGSLASHMTIMHSRNSCKTLKCPKCNWHYKSQHTLQMHMREKHPETGGQCVCGGDGKCACGGASRGACGFCSSGKPHPRLARGETYACGYKPYRCEACDYATSSKGNLSIHMQSDKHLNNVQGGALAHSAPGGQEEQAFKLALLPVHPANTQPPRPALTMAAPPQQQPLSPTTTATLAPQSGPPGKRWRCDVCDYETSIARNLRIHTTSEKHTHNLLRLQRGYYLSHCRSLGPPLKHMQNAGAELPLNLHLTAQQLPEPPMGLGSTLTPSPSPSPSPPPTPSLSPAAAPLSLGSFQCLVCSSFSSDSLEAVEQHAGAPRSLPQADWCTLVAGGCHCRLCGYTTPLRANFSLHCQTDRHRTRYQLAAHLQEGGERGQEAVAALIAKGNPVQLRCNLCDYPTASVEKLRGHARGSHHETSVRVYRFLQQYEDEVGGGSWMFHCLVCNHSSSSKLQLLKHSQTPTHRQREGLLQLQPMGGDELAAIFTIRKSLDGVMGELSEDIGAASEAAIGPLDQTKDPCNFGVEQNSKDTDTLAEQREKKKPLKRSSPECEETESPLSPKRPRTHQQNENQQSVQCPLCQVQIPYTHLRQHLTYLHSVAQDCVDKLIGTVSTPMEPAEADVNAEYQTYSDSTDFSQKNGSCTDETNVNVSNTDSPAIVESHKNKDSSVENTEEGDAAAPKDVAALLTPPLEEPASQPSSGRPPPQSPTRLTSSSPPGDPPSSSDRHGYRFRCSRCSLAFPTREKLQLHWQYHAMRAATECPLCSRRCRSQEALQRHMQNTHSQLEASTQSTLLLLSPAGQTQTEQRASSVQQDISLSPRVGQEAGEGDEDDDDNDDLEDEALEVEGKDERRDEGTVAEKDPAAEADVGEEDLLDVERGRREDVGSDPGPSLQLRTGTNPTLDRFLDPSRPYKCTVCSESFTQKTILLVHYNSVSHLHRARRALQDSGPGLATPETPRGPDPRPYRCRLCGVGYSQSSTLDIHLRSVLHQTRARAAQNTASQTPAAGSTAPGQTPATTAEETSESLPLPKRSELVSSPPSSSSFSIVSAIPVADTQSDIQQAKKRVAELLASRNQLMLMQQQQLAQAQAQLQQHTALLQSQLFNPALLQHLPLGPESLLKQHFSLAPDNFLSLQQQLLLPFYLSGEMKLNPELMLKSPELIQTSAASFASTEQLREYLTEPAPPRREKESQKQSSDSTVAQQNVQCEAKVGAGCSGSLVDRGDMENHSTDDVEKTKDTAACGVKTEKHTEENKQAGCTSGNRPELEFPPPRVPYAAVNGEPLRALLQIYGYEMALQYTQSRHRSQLKIATHVTPEGQGNSGVNYKEVSSERTREDNRQLGGVNAEGCSEENRQKESGNEESKCLVEERSKQEELPKGTKACCRGGEKCRDCGKLFSDALVLKSHQEYIHRLLFPTAVLERFSREYRSQYDRLYPLTHLTADEARPASAPEAAQSSELEAPASEAARPLAKTPPPTPDSSASDTAKMPAPTADPTPSPATPSPPPPSPEPPKEEGSTVGNPNASLPLPNLPMLPLSMPQLSLPPLPLAKLPLPPIPFSMELPMLPSVVMQSVALQSQPWLDSSVTSDLAKLYQQQLSPSLLGQQPKLSTALLAQQQQKQQLSPALLGQPPQQLSPVLQRQGSPAPAEQGRRARTRISDEQLSVLRCHFDISTLPSDEEINKMAARCGLPHKVIKHWFRNTLFKERQRDKDSPYNFNNPPTTLLDEVRGDAAPLHALPEPPSSLSPGLPSNHSPHPPKGDSSPRGDAGRGRRSSRTRFTEKQLETLQGVFETTPYPREEEYDKLSAMLALPNRVIVVWFQNARQRARKHQERGTEDGAEGKTQADGGQRQRGGVGLKSGDGDQEEGCGDGQGDRQNENSMDFTYEYYTHPDSPEVDSPPPQPAKAELSAVCKKQDDDDACLTQAEKSPPSVHTQSGSPESHIRSQNKETVNAAQKTTMPRLKAEITASRPQTNCSSSHKTPCRSYPGHASSPPSIPAMEKPAHTPHNLPPAPECETGIPRLPDPTLGISPETQPQNPLQQHQTLTQFQCSLCPMSLPSLQLWQDHQARHLLAAQSQVQLLHTGFTDCSMPYMMVHPNHTLMASQLLSSAMSQMHPSPGHPIMSHMNGLHSKHPLSGLPQTSLSSSAMKQSSKVTAEAGCDAPGGGREVEEEHRRDKRQRTTITPEQLEVLYQRYSMDSNPTRGVLESIARDVGLKRRVVQVWFQNTRARERKGQFRSTGPGASFSLGLNHLRCPFCRALFKVKSALEAHMRSRHWAEAERAGYSLSMAPGGPLGSMAASSMLERAGPSASSASSPTPGSLFCVKELHARPPLTLDCSSTELTNPDEDEDYEEDEEEEYVCEEGSSVAEQGSFSPEGSVGPGAEWGEMHTQRQQQQQRQRTQMSHFQVLQLRDFYRSHRTPNRQECEALGRDLGLPHRVVQVWFQNARAKEKRARSAGPDSAEREQAELTAVAGERDRA